MPRPGRCRRQLDARPAAAVAPARSSRAAPAPCAARVPVAARRRPVAPAARTITVRPQASGAGAPSAAGRHDASRPESGSTRSPSDGGRRPRSGEALARQVDLDALRPASPRASPCARPRTAPPCACGAPRRRGPGRSCPRRRRPGASSRSARASASLEQRRRARLIGRAHAGRVGRHVRQHDVERRQRPQQLGVGRGEDVAQQDARARRSAGAAGSRSIPTTAPVRPDHRQRVLQPRARPAAEVEHAVARRAAAAACGRSPPACRRSARRSPRRAPS